MKQLKTTTKSGEYLLVELPEMRIANPISSIYSGLLEPIGQLSGISGDLKSDILEGIRKEGWYTENPWGVFEDAVTAPPGCVARVPEESKWEDAEEKTLDPDKTYCFKIIQ